MADFPRTALRTRGEGEDPTPAVPKDGEGDCAAPPGRDEAGLNIGVSAVSLSQVIFSFGVAPEYDPYDVVESEIWQK